MPLLLSERPKERRAEMDVIIAKDYEEMSKRAAEMIKDLVKSKPDAVLGLATGSTPVGAYKELIRMHKEEGLDFSNVATFNLDEYVGLVPEHDQGYRYFMNKNLFEQINIKIENTHVPDGMAEDIESHCREYEEMIRQAGGIDLQVLGIGSNGHIAFNEPGGSLESRTHKETLTENTLKDNARFFKSMDEVPRYALTMGIGTIMEARRIILLASGGNKADAVCKAVEGPVTEMVPASVLQNHSQASVITDKDAGAALKGNIKYEPDRRF